MHKVRSEVKMLLFKAEPRRDHTRFYEENKNVERAQQMGFLTSERSKLTESTTLIHQLADSGRNIREI